MRFRLRYLKHDLKLSVGTFVIGRSADCQLSLDDPLVSRRHAMLLVGEDEVFVDDAGSRNGVVVNGAKINGRTRLESGDRVTIGAQEMTITVDSAADAGKQTWLNTPMNIGPVTMTMPLSPMATGGGSRSPNSISANDTAAPIEDSTMNSPRRGEALRLLGGVADKASRSATPRAPNGS